MTDYCDLQVAKFIADENKDCRTRSSIARILWAYYQHGYNVPTLLHASLLMQVNAKCLK